ncbi:hypothetical protein GCM10009753_77630 [Streptantibioticus ferralitis]
MPPSDTLTRRQTHMPLLDLDKITSGLSKTWAGFLRDWDRSLRSGNYPVGLKNTNRRLALKSFAVRNRESRSQNGGSASSGIMFRDPVHGVHRHARSAVAARVASAA